MEISIQFVLARHQCADWSTSSYLDLFICDKMGIFFFHFETFSCCFIVSWGVNGLWMKNWIFKWIINERIFCHLRCFIRELEACGWNLKIILCFLFDSNQCQEIFQENYCVCLPSANGDYSLNQACPHWVMNREAQTLVYTSLAISVGTSRQLFLGEVVLTSVLYYLA